MPLRPAISADVRAESDARHQAKVHPDGSTCAHERSPDVLLALVAEADRRLSALVLTPDQESALAQAVDERYGPILAWRPGDPAPEPTADDLCLHDPNLRRWWGIEEPDQGLGQGSDW